MNYKNLKIASSLFIILVFAFTMTACDTAMNGQNVSKTGDLYITASIEDSIKTLSAKSSKNETLNVIEERGSDYELIIKIKHKKTGREKIYSPSISDYNDLITKNSFNFKKIATGNWAITVNVKAEIGEYGKTTIAREEKIVTATVSAGQTITTAVNVIQEKGGLVLNAGDGITNLSDLKTLELKDSNGTVRIFNSDDNIWENLNAKHYELFVELTKDDITYSQKLSIMILPGITQNITINIVEGSSGFNISYNFPPKIPEGLTASADNTNEKIILNWTSNSNVNSYNIVRREPYSSRNHWEVIAKDITTNSYEDKTVITNIFYEYAIVAVNDNLSSDYSQHTDPTGLNVEYLSFNKSSDLDNWESDRKAPNEFVTTSFEGNERLKLSIDPSDAPSNEFYQYQGMKYTISGLEYTSIDLYIPSNWENSNNIRAGLWATGYDSNDNISLYPIIEFTNNDSNPRFRVWPEHPTEGGWLTLINNINYGSWYTIEMILDVNNNLVTYNVGNSTHQFGANNTVKFDNIILQGHNPVGDGADYDIYYDNLKLK